MVIAVSAWVPVVGTIGGVIAGGLVTGLIERERWKREDRTRWHEDRRQIYARFLQAADAYSTAGTSLANEIGMRRSDPHGADQVEEDKVASAVVNMNAKAEVLRPLEWEIELVGGKEVRAAADRVVGLATRHVGAEITAMQRMTATSDAVANAAGKAANEAAKAAVDAVEKSNRRLAPKSGWVNNPA